MWFVIFFWIVQALIVLACQICSIWFADDEKRKYNENYDFWLNWWQLLGGLLIPFSVPLYIIFWTFQATYKKDKEQKKKE